MWIQEKNKRSTVVIELNYEDFAHIIVEKKSKGLINQFTINFEIDDILNDTFNSYDLKEVTKVLEIIKKEIEELYDQIPLFDEQKIQNWIDEFYDKIND